MVRINILLRVIIHQYSIWCQPWTVINQALFKPNDSDIHADIAILGSCLQNRISTNDATVYIAVPPCKRYFGTVCAAGIKLFHMRNIPRLSGVKARNVEFVTISRESVNQPKDSISELIKWDGKECNVTDEIERRKEEKRKPMEDGSGGGIKVLKIL